jgi:hypothetical protein
MPFSCAHCCCNRYCIHKGVGVRLFPVHIVTINRYRAHKTQLLHTVLLHLLGVFACDFGTKGILWWLCVLLELLGPTSTVTSPSVRQLLPVLSVIVVRMARLLSGTSCGNSSSC